MTCGRREPLRFHHFSPPTTTSYSSLSVSSSLNTFSIFSILLSVSVCQVAPSILKDSRAPTQIHSQGSQTDVCVCAWFCACAFICLCFTGCILHILHLKSKYLDQIAGGILCVYWQMANSWIRCHVFIRHFIQQAENWPEYLPCSSVPSAAWMQTQQLWLLLTVTTRTGCLRRLSEDLLLYLHRAVRRMSQIKQEIVFLPEILLEFTGS